MRTSIKFLFLAIFGIVLASCDPGDLEIKKLNRNDGTWEIVSVHYETYDSLGQNVVSDSTQTGLGEFVFFKSPTMDALWDGYLVMANMNETDGSISAHPGVIFFDSKRVFMQEDPDSGHNFPDQFEGLWTVTEDGRKNQEWCKYFMDANSNLSYKETIKLKKK